MHRDTVGSSYRNVTFRWLMGLLFLSLLVWGCDNGGCPQPCQQGQALCSAQGIAACAFDPQTQCLVWQLQVCPAGQQCIISPTGPACQGAAKCQDPYHEKKCIGQVLFWYDECGRQREVALTCPQGTVCKDGACAQGNDPNACVTECGPGQSRCTDAGWRSICERKSERCYKWGDPVECPAGNQCREGSCQQGPCHDLCPPGATRCQGTGIQTCTKVGSGCAKWDAVYKCQPGQTCQQNQCVQAECPKQCSITADCLVAACGTKTACVNGVCALPPKQCTDKCTLGQTRCQGVQLQACRREAHGCTDWGPPASCLTGQVCSQGSCVPAPCPATCTNDTDCGVAACGSRTKCQNGQCAVPAGPTCPASCSTNTQCNVSACGARIACTNGVCAVPQQQCPGSCTTDSQCAVPGCGSRRSCQNSVCVTPQQQCPASCTTNAQCNIAACGARVACTNGACAVPQQQCPASCTTSSQCNIAACGTRTTCQSGACAAPQAQCPASCTQHTQCAITACGTKTSCTNSVCSVPSASGWKYGKNVKFENHPVQNSKTNASWGANLTDIMQHQQPGQQVLTFPNPVILGHETLHFIQNELRNNYTLAAGRKVNAFYVLQNRAIKVNEPNFKLSEVAAFVPLPLQHSRYKHYLIEQQKHWNDRPLYLVDEWTCYTLDSEIAVQLSKAGMWTYGAADDVKGPMEFLVYGLALAMATEQKDPTYFKTYTQFLETIAYIAARGIKAHREGVKFKNFQGFGQVQYMIDLQTHAAAKNMRDFAVRVFGQKWVDEVIFGKP